MLAGGNTYEECLKYLKTFSKELSNNSILVENTFNGAVSAEENKIEFQFPAIDFESTAAQELKDNLSKGFTPETIKQVTDIFRYRAFRLYFDKCNAFFDKLLLKTKTKK